MFREEKREEAITAPQYSLHLKGKDPHKGLKVLSWKVDIKDRSLSIPAQFKPKGESEEDIHFVNTVVVDVDKSLLTTTTPMTILHYQYTLYNLYHIHYTL